MSTRINDIAPNFTAVTTQGRVDFHQWIGDGRAILLSHPKVATPAGWKQDEDVVTVPALSDEEVKKTCPEGFHTLKRCSRTSPQPR